MRKNDSEAEVDPATQTIIQQLTEYLDGRIDTLKAELKEEITGGLADHFGPRHDEMCERMTSVEDRFEVGMDLFSRWADGIQRNTAYTRMLATEAFSSTGKDVPPPATPELDDPRPPEIDLAVKADPADGVQRVDLPGYGAVLFIQPGIDAEEGWAAAANAIRLGRRRRR